MKIINNSSSTFSLAGWLFADMFLLLAMIFLLANTFYDSAALPTPTRTPTATLTLAATKTVTPTPTRAFTPVPTPLVGLDLTPHRFTVLVRPDLLMADNQWEIDQLKKNIALKMEDYNDRRAGLVITLGYHTQENIPFARQFAEKANQIICQTYPQVFDCGTADSGTVMKTYWWDADINKPVGTLEFEIYYFNR